MKWSHLHKFCVIQLETHMVCLHTNSFYLYRTYLFYAMLFYGPTLQWRTDGNHLWDRNNKSLWNTRWVAKTCGDKTFCFSFVLSLCVCAQMAIYFITFITLMVCKAINLHVLYLFLCSFNKSKGRIHGFLKYLQIIIINQFNTISFMYEAWWGDDRGNE